jgi:hypothetical protein
MEGSDDHTHSAKPAKEYRRLPPAVRLDQTIATVQADRPPDPEAGRNVDQHRALRDD